MTNIGRLLALKVPVIVTLSSRRMRLSEVMRLSPGTIIEFDKPASEPLDLLVNNVPVGRGDVVKIGENFGLRVSRIGRPQQMIRALGGSTANPTVVGTIGGGLSPAAGQPGPPDPAGD